jgi:hypothetical protein
MCTSYLIGSDSWSNAARRSITAGIFAADSSLIVIAQGTTRDASAFCNHRAIESINYYPNKYTVGNSATRPGTQT